MIPFSSESAVILDMLGTYKTTVELADARCVSVTTMYTFMTYLAIAGLVDKFDSNTPVRWKKREGATYQYQIDTLWESIKQRSFTDLARDTPNLVPKIRVFCAIMINSGRAELHPNGETLTITGAYPTQAKCGVDDRLFQFTNALLQACITSRLTINLREQFGVRHDRLVRALNLLIRLRLMEHTESGRYRTLKNVEPSVVPTGGFFGF